VSESNIPMVALRDVNELGIRAGDLITWDPDDARCPIIISRAAPFSTEDLLRSIDNGSVQALCLRRASIAVPSSSRELQVDRDASVGRASPRLQLLRRTEYRAAVQLEPARATP
jgi:hypothetical protein